MKKERKLRIFMCHASQDKPIVRELRNRLAGEKWIDPWLDEDKLLPGEDWRTSIEEAVDKADLVVICLSKKSVLKEGYVQKELRYAKEISLEKPEGSFFLIPLRLDDCIVPRGLQFLQRADYFGDKKEDSYELLLESFNFRYKQLEKRDEALSSSQDGKGISRLWELNTLLSDYFDMLEERSTNQDRLSDLSTKTGFSELDRILLGFDPGDFIVISGRAGHGKTSFLVSLIRNIITDENKLGVFFCLGTGNMLIIHRLIAQISGIAPQKLRVADLSQDEWMIFTEAIEQVVDKNWYFDDSSFIEPETILNKCSSLHMERKLDLIFVDDAHRISSHRSSTNQIQYDSLVILKQIARELNVPVIASVQLPARNEIYSKEIPTLSELDSVVSVSDIADVVLLLHSPDLNKDTPLNTCDSKLIIAKQSTGPTGQVDLTFNKEYAGFHNKKQKNKKENP